jgi:hypothetical protein
MGSLWGVYAVLTAKPPGAQRVRAARMPGLRAVVRSAADMLGCSGKRSYMQSLS